MALCTLLFADLSLMGFVALETIEVLAVLLIMALNTVLLGMTAAGRTQLL